MYDRNIVARLGSIFLCVLSPLHREQRFQTYSARGWPQHNARGWAQTKQLGLPQFAEIFPRTGTRVPKSTGYDQYWRAITP